MSAHAECAVCHERQKLTRDLFFPVHHDPLHGGLCVGSKRHPDDVARVEQTKGYLSTAAVAKLFDCSKRKVSEEAKRIGGVVNLGGRAGYRFTDADVERLRKVMAPPAVVEGRRTA